MFVFLFCHILNVYDYRIQLLRLVIILSYLGMPVNLVQYRGTVGVFNNRKFRNKMVANKFYSSKCGFNAELAVLEPSSLHQIILLLLTIVMCMSKDNYVQSIKRLCISFIITISIHSILPLWFYSISITLSGDVETNPGPKRNSTETFSFCHWNLNSISSHNYVKISLLKAYITVHKFDIICLSQAYMTLVPGLMMII